MSVATSPGRRPGAGTLAAADADVAAVRSLYLHIPFCERKCSYCDFTSVAGARGQRDYTTALVAELRAIGAALPGVEIDTVFVGGGTPSLLPPSQLAELLGTVRSEFALATGAEVTMEANPSSTSARRAAVWREAGFNRVSIGVQALEPDVLGFLERIHSPERALAAVAEVRSAGFDAVNCDLIYAVPGLDDARWSATVERLLEVDPGHLSCYELTVEDETPLAVAVSRGEVREVDPDAALRQHWIAVDLAERAGYEQYEVSALARHERRCRHNLAYWGNRFYLAAGVGAHGHLPAGAAGALGIGAGSGAAVRYWHTESVPAYVRAAADGLLPVAGSEAVGEVEREEERILLGLRRIRDGVTLAGAAVPEAEALGRAGLLEWDGLRARVTRRGQEVLDAVALRLVAAATG